MSQSLIDLEKTKEKTETIKPMLKEREIVPEKKQEPVRANDEDDK